MEDYYVHPCHCTEISMDEYRRVAGMKPCDDRMEKFLLEKEQLKTLSDERIKKWPNTLKNLRENRVKARKARLEREEEGRRKQDVLDATYRAQKRREQERDEQIKCKEKLNEGWRNKNKWWHEMLMRDYRRGVVEDEQELQRRREVAISVQKMQSEQLEERHQQFLKELDEKKKEGERLKKLAAENVAVAEEMDRQKHLRQIESNVEFVKLNKELQARREAEKEKLKLLDLKIAEYVAMKEKRDAANKAEKERVENEKNARRDYMIKKLAQHLLTSKAEADQRLGAEAQESRIAEDMREVLAGERRKHEWNICDRSRKQQMYLKKLQDEMDRQDAKDISHQVWQRAIEIQEADEAQFKNTLEQNKVLAQHRKKQELETKIGIKKERELEIIEAKNNWRKMEDDDKYIRSIDIFN